MIDEASSAAVRGRRRQLGERQRLTEKVREPLVENLLVMEGGELGTCISAVAHGSPEASRANIR